MIAPLLLIFVGGVFLLQNTGALPPNFWLSLWRLWPLIFVLVGLELLLGQRVPKLVLFVIAAAFLIAGVVMTDANLRPAALAMPAQASTSNEEIDLGSANRAAINLHLNAGQLTVGALTDAKPTLLALVSYQGPAGYVPEARYSTSSDGVGQLDYQLSGRGGPDFIPLLNGGPSTTRMDLSLVPSVPIDSLKLQTGAADAHLDLSDLHVNSVDMSIGAAALWLRVPQSTPLTTVNIRGGASTVTLEVPNGVAAQISRGGGLGTFNVDQSRFPAVSDGVYRSADYDSAANKVDIKIDTGASAIEVN